MQDGKCTDLTTTRRPLNRGLLAATPATYEFGAQIGLTATEWISDRRFRLSHERRIWESVLPDDAGECPGFSEEDVHH
jgi:hypothetical protein